MLYQAWGLPPLRQFSLSEIKREDSILLKHSSTFEASGMPSSRLSVNVSQFELALLP
jgi:hypothetical protein